MIHKSFAILQLNLPYSTKFAIPKYYVELKIWYCNKVWRTINLCECKILFLRKPFVLPFHWLLCCYYNRKLWGHAEVRWDMTHKREYFFLPLLIIILNDFYLIMLGLGYVDGKVRKFSGLWLSWNQRTGQRVILKKILIRNQKWPRNCHIYDVWPKYLQ